MKNQVLKENEKPETEPIVITDECGDSMWDAVLQQEVKTCDTGDLSKTVSALLNSIHAVQVSPSSIARSEDNQSSIENLKVV